MRNMFSKRLVCIAVGVSLGLGTVPANAFFGVGDVVTDPGLTGQMVMANAKAAADAAMQIQNQMNMYTNMITNTLSLRDTALAPLGNMFRSLNTVWMQGQSLMYRAQNLDQQFGYMYPSYQSYLYSMGTGGPTVSTLYKQWSDQGNENVRTALKAAGVQVNSMQSDEQMLQQLIARSNTAEGQKAALQAGNLLAGMTVQQMQKLQSLVGTQIEMQANFIAQQNARQSADDAWVDNYRRVPVTNSTAKEY